MKIEKTKRVLEKLYNIHELNNLNNELFLKVCRLLQQEDVTYNEELLKEELKKGKKLENIIAECFEDFGLDDFMIKKYIYNNIEILEKDKLNNNAYIKRFKEFYKEKINQIKLDNISFSYTSFAKNQMILLDTPTEINYVIKPKIGFFKESFDFPILTENQNVWMSITPSEINTMQEHIDKVKGNVLVFGCGLGYFPYMISLKDNVNNITIVERNENIIKIFNENILPFFENKNKVTIVHDDCFNYLQNINIDFFDYCFCDIWYNNEDGTPLYLKFKQLENKYKNTKFLYWIERDILYKIKSYIYLNILNEVFPLPNTNLLNTIKIENSEKILKYLDEIDIKRPEDIDYYLDINNIKRFL